MWVIRELQRRIPLGPTLIALTLITLLVLTNLYGSGSDPGTENEGRAPSGPVGIPPQLPAQQQTPDPAEEPAGPSPSPRPQETASTQPPVTPTVTVTTTVTAPAPGAPGGDRPDGGAQTPAGGDGTGRPDEGPQVGTPGKEPDGGSGGTPTATPSVPPVGDRLRVVDVGLSSDRPNGGFVRCNGRDELVLAGTVFVEGGAGEVIYQWVFDGVRTWPPDVLRFTGTGARQQTLQIPWPVPMKFLGRVRGTVQLRILQPVVNAQTRSVSIDLICA